MKKIAIAGAGGIGSNLLAILFDYGYNRKQFDYASTDIDIYDDDTVDTKNLLHQNFKAEDIGKRKVEVLENKYVVNGIPRRITVDDFSNYDMLFCCVDNMPFRKALYEYGWEHPNFFWIDGRCNSRQGAIFHSLLPRKKLEHWISDSQEEGGCLLDWEKENNISHALPLVVSAAMLQMFLNKLRGQTSYETALFI